MLPKGSISKIYEYYFTTPHFHDEIMRAMREFFDRPDLASGGLLETDERSEGLFNEWFLYDFMLNENSTALADFIKNNPLGLIEAEINLCKDILTSNIYGMFEVKGVDVNNGLTIQNIKTSEMIWVREQKLTHQVAPGDVFFGRIGKVGNHYELIGADSFLLHGVDKKIKKVFQEIKFQFTPKIAYDIWRGSSKI